MSKSVKQAVKALRDPIEVWKAVEGDRTELIALLRGDEPLSRRERDALADYLAGDLKPVKFPRGKPPKSVEHPYWMINDRWTYAHGHDTSTDIGHAGLVFEALRRHMEGDPNYQFPQMVERTARIYGDRPYARGKLIEAVARHCSVEEEQLKNAVDRSRKKPPPEDFSAPEYIQRRRMQIALEVRRNRRS